MASELFWLGFSFVVSLAATLLFSREKRSLPFYFVLLLVLGVLFGLPAIPAFALALAWRYSKARRKV